MIKKLKFWTPNPTNHLTTTPNPNATKKHHHQQNNNTIPPTTINQQKEATWRV